MFFNNHVHERYSMRIALWSNCWGLSEKCYHVSPHVCVCCGCNLFISKLRCPPSTLYGSQLILCKTKTDFWWNFYFTSTTGNYRQSVRFGNGLIYGQNARVLQKHRESSFPRSGKIFYLCQLFTIYFYQ